MFTVELKEDRITGALDALATGMDDLTKVMQRIGDSLLNSTNDRFKDGVSPEGVAWRPKSPKTRSADPRPLIDIGTLSSNIKVETTADSVEIGSPRVYAAMMQFGGTKAQFPHLFGDIPARPFLGISDLDRTNILEEIEEWLLTISDSAV